MDLYVWSGVFSFVANAAIGFFILSRDPQEKKNRLFCLFSLSVAGWSVGSSLANIIPDKALALWVVRLNYFWGIWTPSLYVHFAHAFSHEDSSLKRRKRIFFYACSALLSPLVFTPFFIPSLRVIENTSFYISRPGPFYYVFFVFFSLAMSEVIFQIFMGLRTRVGLEFRQFKYLAVANFLAIAAGFEYFLRVFGILSRPPLDDYILILSVMILAYGVTRHRLFDVEALVKALRKERLATLGLLASSINHEIKNPIYIIKGLLENSLDEERATFNDPAAIKALLEKIYSQTNRIGDLITRINKLFREGEPKKHGGIQQANAAECLANLGDRHSPGGQAG